MLILWAFMFIYIMILFLLCLSTRINSYTCEWHFHDMFMNFFIIICTKIFQVNGNTTFKDTYIKFLCSLAASDQSLLSVSRWAWLAGGFVCSWRASSVFAKLTWKLWAAASWRKTSWLVQPCLKDNFIWVCKIAEIKRNVLVYLRKNIGVLHKCNIL